MIQIINNNSNSNHDTISSINNTINSNSNNNNPQLYPPIPKIQSQPPSNLVPLHSHLTPSQLLQKIRPKILFLSLSPLTIRYLRLRIRQQKYQEICPLFYSNVEEIMSEEGGLVGEMVVVVIAEGMLEEFRELYQRFTSKIVDVIVVKERQAQQIDGFEQYIQEMQNDQPNQEQESIQSQYCQLQQQQSQKLRSQQQQDQDNNVSDSQENSDSSSNYIRLQPTTQPYQPLTKNHIQTYKYDSSILFHYLPSPLSSLSPTTTTTTTTQPKNVLAILTQLNQYEQKATNFLLITNTTPDNKRKANQYCNAIARIVNTVYQNQRNELKGLFQTFLKGMPEAKLETYQWQSGANDEQQNSDGYKSDHSTISHKLTHYQATTDNNPNSNSTSTNTPLHTIFHLYTEQNSFHKSVNKYLKYFYTIPQGLHFLQYPITVMLECMQALFQGQLAILLGVLGWMRQGGLGFYRGCYLGEGERAMFGDGGNGGAIGHIVMHTSFMSTSADIGRALTFAKTQPGPQGKKYLLQITVTYEQLAYYALSNNSSNNNKENSNSNKIRIGQGLVLLKQYSDKPQQAEALFNLLNYYQVMGVREMEYEGQIIKIYELKYINALKIAQQPYQTSTYMTISNSKPCTFKQLHHFYQHQAWLTDKIHTPSDALLYGQYYKQAKLELDREMDVALGSVFGGFCMEEFVKFVGECVERERREYGEWRRKGAGDIGIGILGQIDRYVQENKIGIKNPQQLYYLLDILHKQITHSRQHLKISQMYTYTTLYLLLLKYSPSQSSSSVSLSQVNHQPELQTILWKVYGLNYLGDCYFLWGIEDIRMILLKQAYTLCERLSKSRQGRTWLHNGRIMQRIISNMIETYRTLNLSPPQPLLHKLSTLVTKNPPNTGTMATLFALSNPTLYSIHLQENMRATNGGNCAAVVYGMFVRSYIDGYQGKGTEQQKIEGEGTKGYKRTLGELFGTYDQAVIRHQIAKYYGIFNKILWNIQQPVYKKRQNSIKEIFNEKRKALKNINSRQRWQDIRDSNYMKEIFHKFVAPFIDNEKGSKKNNILIKIGSGTIKNQELSLYQQLEPIIITIWLKIKHKILQRHNFQPQPLCIQTINQQTQPQSLQLDQQAQLLHTCLSLPPENQDTIRIVYVRIYAEYFVLYAQDLRYYDRCAGVYEKWKAAVGAVMGDGVGEEEEEGNGRDMLYFQWMVLMDSLTKIISGFEAVQKYIVSLGDTHNVQKLSSLHPNLGPILNTLTLTTLTQNFLLPLFHSCVRYLQLTRYASPQHLSFLYQYYNFLTLIDTLRRKRLTDWTLGCPEYFQLLVKYQLGVRIGMKGVWEDTGWQGEIWVCWEIVKGFYCRYETWKGNGKGGRLTEEQERVLRIFVRQSWILDSYYWMRDMEEGTDFHRYFIDLAQKFQIATPYKLIPNPNSLDNPLSQQAINLSSTSIPIQLLTSNSNSNPNNNNNTTLSQFLTIIHSQKISDLFLLLNTRIYSIEIDEQFVRDQELVISTLRNFIDVIVEDKKDVRRFQEQICQSNGEIVMNSYDKQFDNRVIIQCLLFYINVHSRILCLWRQLFRYRQKLGCRKLQYFIKETLFYYQDQPMLYFRLTMLSKIQHIINLAQSNPKSKTPKYVNRQLQKLLHQTSLDLSQLPNPSHQTLTLPSHFLSLSSSNPFHQPYPHQLSLQLEHYISYTTQKFHLYRNMPHLGTIFLVEEFEYWLAITPVQEHLKVIYNTCVCLGGNPAYKRVEILANMLGVLQRMYRGVPGVTNQRILIIYDSIMEIVLESLKPHSKSSSDHSSDHCSDPTQEQSINPLLSDPTGLYLTLLTYLLTKFLSQLSPSPPTHPLTLSLHSQIHTYTKVLRSCARGKVTGMEMREFFGTMGHFLGLGGVGVRRRYGLMRKLAKFLRGNKNRLLEVVKDNMIRHLNAQLEYLEQTKKITYKTQSNINPQSFCHTFSGTPLPFPQSQPQSHAQLQTSTSLQATTLSNNSNSTQNTPINSFIYLHQRAEQFTNLYRKERYMRIIDYVGNKLVKIRRNKYDIIDLI